MYGMATPGGLEPPTPDLEGPCSIQLSYEAGTFVSSNKTELIARGVSRAFPFF